jgi:hypothetical protein
MLRQITYHPCVPASSHHFSHCSSHQSGQTSHTFHGTTFDQYPILWTSNIRTRESKKPQPASSQKITCYSRPSFAIENSSSAQALISTIYLCTIGITPSNKTTREVKICKYLLHALLLLFVLQRDRKRQINTADKLTRKSGKFPFKPISGEAIDSASFYSRNCPDPSIMSPGSQREETSVLLCIARWVGIFKTYGLKLEEIILWDLKKVGRDTL